MGSCCEERTDTNSRTATTAGGTRTAILSCEPQGKILSKDEPVSTDSHNKVFVVKNTCVSLYSDKARPDLTAQQDTLVHLLLSQQNRLQ